MNFVASTLAQLKQMSSGTGYAGGSNINNLPDFKSYIKGSRNFGECKASDFSTCYYTEVEDIEAAENSLLQLNFSCNIYTVSSLKPNQGFVYVMK